MDAETEGFYNLDLRSRLDHAEMTNENGIILTGSLPFTKLSIPGHIGLAGDYLSFWDDIDYSRDEVSDTGALATFIRIKSPNDIRRFALRYGPLGLCKHGYPPMHRGSWYRDVIKNGELSEVIQTGEWNPAGGGSDRGWCPPCGPEPIEKWFDYVSLAKSYLGLAAVLRVDTGKRKRGLRQLFLMDGINEWLGDAGIRLQLNWSSNEPILTLTGGRVFGALGVQLLSAVTANKLAVCSGCGTPYLRKRKPQTGRHNFCSECGDKVANKLRVRKWRATKQEGGKP